MLFAQGWLKGLILEAEEELDLLVNFDICLRHPIELAAALFLTKAHTHKMWN